MKLKILYNKVRNNRLEEIIKKIIFIGSIQKINKLRIVLFKINLSLIIRLIDANQQNQK